MGFAIHLLPLAVSKLHSFAPFQMEKVFLKEFSEVKSVLYLLLIFSYYLLS